MSAERHGRPAPSRAGLTLIEVLLAFALLGGGLAVLIAATAQGLGLVRQTRQYQIARLLLDAVAIDHPLGDVRELADQVEEGEFDPPYQAFRWARVVIPEDEDDAQKPTYLYQVRTRVRWSERGRESGEELVTYLFAPEDSSAAAASPTTQPEMAPGEAAAMGGRGGRRRPDGAADGQPNVQGPGARGGRRGGEMGGGEMGGGRGQPGGNRGQRGGGTAMPGGGAPPPNSGASAGQPGRAARAGNAALPGVRVSTGGARAR